MFRRCRRAGGVTGTEEDRLDCGGEVVEDVEDEFRENRESVGTFLREGMTLSLSCFGYVCGV